MGFMIKLSGKLGKCVSSGDLVLGEFYAKNSSSFH